MTLAFIGKVIGSQARLLAKITGNSYVQIALSFFIYRKKIVSKTLFGKIVTN